MIKHHEMNHSATRRVKIAPDPAVVAKADLLMVAVAHAMIRVLNGRLVRIPAIQIFQREIHRTDRMDGFQPVFRDGI